MQKTVFIALFLLLIEGTFPGISFGQSYGTALGLRFGNNNSYRTLGLSLQQLIAKGLTVEAILQSDLDVNTTVHAVVQKHRPLLSRRFNYYYGGGISLGIGESRERVPETRQLIATYGNPSLGLDFIAGVEMTLMGITFSVDYKPNLNLVGRQPWYVGQVGISLRSVVVNSSRQNKKRRQKAREKRRKDSQTFFQKIRKPLLNKEP
ncbi:hypothetical protein [Cyclobacterium xiamenense]|uniref:hypothetical protein n=1 Tax=Cyclobacterium xiamenense TaxID=1297121 RepID=UPI0012B96564|nr:hypothetical protein [Cyclobacterium xiamenense]